MYVALQTGTNDELPATVENHRQDSKNFEIRENFFSRAGFNGQASLDAADRPTCPPGFACALADREVTRSHQSCSFQGVLSC